jgi:hypothetical protein
MNFDFHEESCGMVGAAPEALFDYLDDPHNLARHMESSSAMMAGMRMSIETDNMNGKAVGSIIRMRGRMLGIPLGLEEAVVEREPPRMKAWKTIGEPRLLVIGAYRMGFGIEPQAEHSRLTVFIDYALPRGAIGKLLGRALAPAYARWCCKQMVEDATRTFHNVQRKERASASP